MAANIKSKSKEIQEAIADNNKCLKELVQHIDKIETGGGKISDERREELNKAYDNYQKRAEHLNEILRSILQKKELTFKFIANRILSLYCEAEHLPPVRYYGTNL